MCCERLSFSIFAVIIGFESPMSHDIKTVESLDFVGVPLFLFFVQLCAILSNYVSSIYGCLAFGSRDLHNSYGETYMLSVRLFCDYVLCFLQPCSFYVK